MTSVCRMLEQLHLSNFSSTLTIHPVFLSIYLNFGFLSTLVFLSVYLYQSWFFYQSNSTLVFYQPWFFYQSTSINLDFSISPTLSILIFYQCWFSYQSTSTLQTPPTFYICLNHNPASPSGFLYVCLNPNSNTFE